MICSGRAPSIPDGAQGTAPEQPSEAPTPPRGRSGRPVFPGHRYRELDAEAGGRADHAPCRDHDRIDVDLARTVDESHAACPSSAICSKKTDVLGELRSGRASTSESARCARSAAQRPRPAGKAQFVADSRGRPAPPCLATQSRSKGAPAAGERGCVTLDGFAEDERARPEQELLGASPSSRDHPAAPRGRAGRRERGRGMRAGRRATCRPTRPVAWPIASRSSSVTRCPAPRRRRAVPPPSRPRPRRRSGRPPSGRS